jgi:hypothetical protein
VAESIDGRGLKASRENDNGRNTMQVVTMSGPANSVRDARELLTDASYFVLSKTPVMLEVADDETLLAVESNDPDAPVSVVAHLKRVRRR